MISVAIGIGIGFIAAFLDDMRRERKLQQKALQRLFDDRIQEMKEADRGGED